MNFEEASKKLDQIILELESGKLSFDETIIKLEEGNKLLKLCEEYFNKTKGVISVIKNDIEKILTETE